MNSNKKIIFIGAVQIGLRVLEEICNINPVNAIFTLPLENSDITSGFVDFGPLAEKKKIVIIRTSNVNSKENIELISSMAPELIIVCGWQRLICNEILRIPPLGTIGFHSSLLPKYRGRAPVNWAIIMGERITGITMFYLTPEADTGDIIAQKSFEILLNDDCNTVYKKSADSGVHLIREYLPKILNGLAPRLHNESACYPAYPKRTPIDGMIDFDRSSIDVYNFVRALTKPYPGAFYFDKKGKKIIVWKIEIVFDESRLLYNDVVFETKDFKVRLIEWEEQPLK